MLLAASLVLVVAVAAAAYFAFGSGGPARHRAAAGPRTSPTASTSATPPSPSPSITLGRWQHIAARSIDPVPLTLAELFPVTFTAEGTSFARTVSRKGTSCPAAIVGSRLQRAVRQARCDQVLRASYLSTGRKLMGTIGVLNLVNSTRAAQAGRAVGPSQFIAQLPGKTGLTKKLTSGTGIEEAAVKGHYLILVWGEFTDLHGPHSRYQRGLLEAFLSSLIDKTANVSLTNRMVNGTPSASASASASPRT
ncbi:MAG: hypothetical protein ACLP7J_09575 [Streptosporangiaceae bacterium]